MTKFSACPEEARRRARAKSVEADIFWKRRNIERMIRQIDPKTPVNARRKDTGEWKILPKESVMISCKLSEKTAVIYKRSSTKFVKADTLCVRRSYERS